MEKKENINSFINRELSWIEFNRRVLNEALRKDLPLLERLKFIAITSSNFDEFFMVRVASLKRQFLAGNYITCPSSLSPEQQLLEIRRRYREIITLQYDCLLNELLPALAKEGIIYRPLSNLENYHQDHLHRIFREEIFPVLTPVRFFPEKPEGVFGNMRLHVAFLLQEQEDKQSNYMSLGSICEENEAKPNKEHIALIQIPSSVNRVVFLPEKDGKVGFTFLETIIGLFAKELFPGYTIMEHVVFRIARDADASVDESRDEDFVEAMEQVLSSRDVGSVVRMNISQSSKKLQEILKNSLKLDDSEIFELQEPLDPSVFFEIAGLKGYDRLREPAWKPVDNQDFDTDESIFSVIRKKDLMLHLPYESFSPVIRFLEEAAEDPGVLAIKMTLYRTSGNSPIVRALEKAAKNGKHVTVLVELKARFDEARNIEWAERLDKAGATVVYGIARLKVHAKALLVIRKEEDGLQRYLHLSTGNYNDKTAKLYTDLCLFTSRTEFCYEAGLFFNSITGYSVIPVLKHLTMAPVALRSRLLQLIDREIQKASPELPGKMVIKLNSLADKEIINSLYIASRSNVKIFLIIRGICMLRPGVEGLSENIQVISILDRYLEHARVMWFQNGGNDEFYASSADWMTRNLDGRVELLFPILDSGHQSALKEMLETQLNDTSNAWVLKSDGTYERKAASKQDALRSQAVLYLACKAKNSVGSKLDRREFSVRKKESSQEL